MKKLKIILTSFFTMMMVACLSLGITSIVSAEVVPPAKTTAFEVVDGASIRLSEPTGLRFQIKLGEKEYETLTGTKSLGAIIVPDTFLTVGITAAEIEALTKLDYEVTADKIFAEGGYYYANIVVVNVKYVNLNLKYNAVGYIKDSATTPTVYTPINKLAARDVVYIASSAKADTLAGYTAENIKLFDKYIQLGINSKSGTAEATAIANFEAGTAPTLTVNLNKPETTILAGETETLTAVSIPEVNLFTKWSSSDTAVATVSASGKVTAVSTGTATVTVEKYGASATCIVNVVSGMIIEAENLKTPADGVKNYVEGINKPWGVTSKPSEPASGGAYLSNTSGGSTVVRFHIFSEKTTDSYAKIILRAASGKLKSSGTNGYWFPTAMEDLMFNQTYRIKYGTTAENLKQFYVNDDIVLKGGTTDNPAGDKLLWVNWIDVDFGTLILKPGDNIIELALITAGNATNIDRLEIQYVNDYVKPAELTSIKVKTPPTTTNYLVGETFSTAGMVLEATYSDQTKKDIPGAYTTVTPSGALASTDKIVTISYRGITTTLPINLIANRMKIEAENLKAPADGVKNYVESGIAGNTIRYTPSNYKTTSGGYLGGIFNKSIIRFHIYSDKATTGTLEIAISSTNLTQGAASNSWSPTIMSDMQFNKIYSTKFGAGTTLSAVTVADSVIVKGGTTTNADGDMFLWENWRLINLGEFNFVEGDNILELVVINTEVHMNGEVYGGNIDYLNVNFN